MAPFLSVPQESSRCCPGPDLFIPPEVPGWLGGEEGDLGSGLTWLLSTALFCWGLFPVCTRRKLGFLGEYSGDSCSSITNMSAINLHPNPTCEGSPHHQAILHHQLGVLQFNSILTFSTRGSIRSHRLKAPSHKNCPTLDASRRSRCYLCF